MEDTTVKAPVIWVSEDGSWGTAPIHTAPTNKWSDDDWAEFEEASDNDKWEVIKYLAGKYELTVTTFTP